MISNDLIYDKNLPPKAKALYGLLASRAQLNKLRVCRVGIRKIQEILSIGSSHTVMKLLKVLEEEKWIETVVHTYGRCNVYKVFFNKNCNTNLENDNTTVAKTGTLPMHSVPPININNEDIEYEELLEWNNQRLNN